MPLIVALGLFGMFMGALFHAFAGSPREMTTGIPLALVGVVVVFVGICGWTLEPVDAPETMTTHV
jgi:hypothetical protein